MSRSTLQLPDPEELLKFFQGWWRTGSTIVGTFAAALISANISSPTAYVVSTVVVVLGISATIFVYQREAKGRETDQASKDALSKSAQGAFRGLRRFLRGERLPGPQRRREGIRPVRVSTCPPLRSRSKKRLLHALLLLKSRQPEF
jgi:hypothetical protein